MIIWDRLVEKVDTIKTEYAEVQLKLNVSNTGMFYFENGEHKVYFNGFTLGGMNYLLARLKPYVDVSAVRDLWYSDTPAFVEMVNATRKFQVKSEKRRHADEKLVAAFKVTAHGSVLLAGLMVNYNPVSHNKVLDMIERANLESKVTQHIASNKELKIRFEGKTVEDSCWKWGLTLFNGETGHVALGYGLYFDFGHDSSYSLDIPFSGRRKHLSLVGEIQDDIEAVLADAMQIDMDNVFLHTPIEAFDHAITNHKAFKPYLRYYDTCKGQPVRKFFAIILRETRMAGRKTRSKAALTKLNNLIVNYAMEKE